MCVGIGESIVADFNCRLTKFYKKKIGSSITQSIILDLKNILNKETALNLDLSIDEIPLGKIAINNLKKIGIMNLNEFISTNRDRIENIKSTQRTVTNILNYYDKQIAQYNHYIEVAQRINIDNLNEMVGNIIRFYTSLDILATADEGIIEELVLVNLDVYQLQGINEGCTEIDSFRIHNQDVWQELNRTFIKYAILLKCFCIGGCSEAELLNCLSRFFAIDFRDLKDYIAELIVDNDLVKNHYNYYETQVDSSYDIILALIEDNKIKITERDLEIYRARVGGMTLQDIGGVFDCTRERIRQIIKRIEKHSNEYLEGCNEYKYKSLITKYNIDKKDLIESFNLSVDEADFIFYKWPQGEVSVIEAYSDEKLSDRAKKSLISLVQSEFIIIGDIFIKRKRHDILLYIIENYCKENTSLDELSEIYAKFTTRYGFYDPELSKQSLAGYIERMPNTLLKYGKLIRFYDFANVDIDCLLDEIHIKELQDVEISTNVFFLKYPEILAKYDIRDKYELHNLLRKLGGEYLSKNVTFLRMPNIAIGNVNREKQVREFLDEVSPINLELFMEQYELKFGVDTLTFSANYLPYIRQYLVNDTLIADIKPLPETACSLIRSQINKNIYHVDALRKILKKIIGDEYLHYFNNYNLKKVGLILRGDLVYLDSDKNAKNALRNYLIKNSKTVLDDEDKLLFSTSTMYAILADLKSSYQILEFQPYSYIAIDVLKSEGIDQKFINDFIDDVLEFTKNEYFTLAKIIEEGYDHPIFELGFDKYFYEELFRANNRVKATSLNNQWIFKEEQEQFFVSDIILNIINGRSNISISNLKKLFFDKFRIQDADKEKLIAAARRAGLYYNQIMDTIYLNEDKFYEEV